MDNHYEANFSRNIGLLSKPEQDRLMDSCIGIAGVGGVGGLLAERLIRLGVGQLKITDPGTFQKSDLNRQYGSSVNTLGQHKAEVIFEQLRGINPQAQIFWSKAGITSQEDAELFVSDCDMIIDEMDISVFKESVFLQRAARHRGIYYLFATALGFGALTVVFDPDGISLEEYNGLSPNLDLSNTDKLPLPTDRVAPVTPSYAADIATDTNIHRILTGEIPAPTVSIGVGLASALAANEATRILLNKRGIVKAPEFIYVDLFDRNFMVGKFG
jgi:molybdopterin/thiamine biosynthesis adenylyltransferase